MKNESDKQLNIPLIVFIASQAIFLILLAISIPSLFKNDKIDGGDFRESTMAPIKNISEVLPGLSSTQIDAIEQSLFGVILNNANGENTSRSEAEGNILPDTVKSEYFASQNVNYFSGVIDIPKLNQSYQIFLTYSDDPNNQYIDPAEPFAIFCPKEEFAILYPDFKCREVFTFSSRSKIVASVISYFDFENFSAFVDDKEPNKIVISPILPEISAETKADFIKRTKEAVSSLGVSPELFNYYVTTTADIDFRLPN